MIKLSTFGQRFKQLRLMKNFTQEQLINDFNKKYHYNLSKSAVSQYENNKRLPEISVLINFADYFNVSIDFLLCRKNHGNELIEEEAEKYILPKDIDKFDLTNLPEELNTFLNSYNNIYFMNKPASKKSIEYAKKLIAIGDRQDCNSGEILDGIGIKLGICYCCFQELEDSQYELCKNCR